MTLSRALIALAVAAAAAACNTIFHIPEATPDGTCEAGYRADGHACIDIDECALASSCLAGATCTNTPGAFTCACPAGMVGDGTTRCVPAAFTKIEAAYNATCAIAEDRTLWCWGSNIYGQLGDGTTIARPEPRQVGDKSDWTDVVAGGAATVCGLRADHSAWCWGSNQYGQLGNGTQDDAATPQRVLSTTGWTAIHVGDVGTCGIHDDGSLACWGRQGNTASGPVSMPTPTAVGTDHDWKSVVLTQDGWCGLRDTTGGNLYCWGFIAFTFYQPSPFRISSDSWQSLAAGTFQVCGVRSDGALFCWGSSPSGEVGNPGGGGPSPIQVGSETDWTAVSASRQATAGLRANGTVYLWGDNTAAVLGTLNQPTVMPTMATGWSTLSVGWTHWCGLRGGKAFCWGFPGDGALGDGTVANHWVPTQVGTSTWQSVALARRGACGVRSDNVLMCWGYSADDGVGLGDLRPAPQPTRVGSARWSMVAGGLYESLCGITNGAISCFGSNAYGQAGIGTLDSPQLRPTIGPTGGWSEVATDLHTCAIQIGDSSLWCWGDASAGELGDGSTSITPRTQPTTPVPGAWLHVAVTYLHTCAIKTDHTLWCWGHSQSGDLGEGSNTSHNAPMQVGSDADWATLATAPGATCAIKTSGALFCWGGRTGDGTNALHFTPVRVGSDADWKQVSVGYGETCAVKTGGTLWCFDGNYSNYGNSRAVHLAPTQVGGDGDWAAVATLFSPNCAIKRTGTLWCWGSNLTGLLGLGAPWITTPVAVNP